MLHHILKGQTSIPIQYLYQGTLTSKIGRFANVRKDNQRKKSKINLT